MGKRDLKKDQRIQYHREFKTGKRSSSKKSRKSAGRRVK
jgi:hypothetical protein